MFDGKRCHRNLLAVVLALVVAMAGAFGSVSMRATAEPAEPATTLNEKKIELKVTGVETGVTGTAYKYMDVNWNTYAGQPNTPEYVFEDEVAQWMRKQPPEMRGGGILVATSTKRTGQLINSEGWMPVVCVLSPTKCLQRSRVAQLV